MGLIDSLKHWFTRSGWHEPEAGPARRIPATSNPYAVELWDCKAFTQSYVATSGDPGVAIRFSELRGSSGNEYRGQEPEDAPTAFECALAYVLRQPLSEGPVFKAIEMEDKWDIYYFSPHLYFARSWTGDLIYKATLRLEAERLMIDHIASAGRREAEHSRRVVDYLVKSHILGALAPHPLPQELPKDPMEIAVHSFSMFGRRCAYGTYDATTKTPDGSSRFAV